MVGDRFVELGEILAIRDLQSATDATSQFPPSIRFLDILKCLFSPQNGTLCQRVPRVRWLADEWSLQRSTTSTCQCSSLWQRKQQTSSPSWRIWHQQVSQMQQVSLMLLGTMSTSAGLKQLFNIRNLSILCKKWDESNFVTFLPIVALE